MHLERISRMCERARAGAGDDRDRGRDAAQREPAARRGQDRRARRDPAAARLALARGPRAHAPPHDGRRRAAVGLELGRHAHGRGDRPHPSRALGRRRLPGRPGRRGRSRSWGASARCATSSTRCSPTGPTRSRGRCPRRSTQLRSERGKHFDPAVVDAFLRIVDDLDPALLRRLARGQHPRQPIGQGLQQQLLARVEDQQRAGLVDVLDGARAARAGRGPRRRRSARRGDRRRGRPRARRRPPRPRRGTTGRRAAAPGPARRRARGGRRAWPPRRPRARRACARAWAGSRAPRPGAPRRRPAPSSPSALARARISSHGRSARSSCSAPRAKASALARSLGPSPKASRAARSPSPRPRRAHACAVVGVDPVQAGGDLVGARRVEAHVLAARRDGGQDLARAVGQQHEVREGGGLLERLEHPVGGLVVHRLGALDDEHAPARLERRPRRGRDDGLVDVGDEHLGGAAGRHPGEVGVHAVLARACAPSPDRRRRRSAARRRRRARRSPCPSRRGRGTGRRGWAGRRAAARR